ncbi:MAG: UDP-2,3-diacylglucosamine diphosphatase [Alistipes sp.]|nr:UDP-2,3-diacylglucosamine diphosphatase [Alistipes sp.]
MIYFASDVHLGAGDASQAHRTEAAFCRWLDMVAKDARAIYLMGDIFDFWFEYRGVVPKGFVRVLGRLAALVERGIEVHLFTGNHDMWSRDYLSTECGVVMHFAPEVVELGGRKFHLAHGDNMNIGGQHSLRLMNTIFRSETARVLFKWLVHPDIAMSFGQWWSGKSRKSHSKSNITPAHLDFLVEYAREHHASHGEVECYIFGHMHLAHDYRDEELRVMFMSDWSGAEASYIALDDSGRAELRTFDIEHLA